MGQAQGTYEGEKNDRGQYEGKGKLTLVDGAVYEGEFSKGRYNGKGKLVSADGDTYEGDFVDGQGHGKGRYTHGATGHEYEGDFKSGRRWGFGKLISPTGDICDGEWYNDLMNGEGTATYKNGGQYVGQWRNGEKSGRGSLTFEDGERYEGEWARNERDGLGVLKHKDGSLYEGEWSVGERKGLGVFWSASNTCYEGEWHEDTPHGYGVEVYNGGQGRYEGCFVNGVRERYGVFYKDGSAQAGNWANGSFVVSSSKADESKATKAAKRAVNAARKARDIVGPSARGAATKTVKPVVYWHATNNFFAIVVGNGKPILPDSLVTDAKNVAKTMVEQGCFMDDHVILLENANQENIRQAVRDINEKMQDNMTRRRRQSVPLFMFFFAGFGFHGDDDSQLCMADSITSTLSMTELHELTADLPAEKRLFIFDTARSANNGKLENPTPVKYDSLLTPIPKQYEDQDQETYVLASCAQGEKSHAREREGSTFTKYFCAALGGRLSKAYHACCGGQSLCVECRKFVASIKLGDGTVYSTPAFTYIATHVVQEHLNQHVTVYSNVGQGGFSPYGPFPISRPVKATEPDYTAALKASE